MRKTKTIAKFEDAGEPVKCWFITTSGQLCFRRKGSRHVDSVSLRDVYDKVNGQQVMPFMVSANETTKGEAA